MKSKQLIILAVMLLISIQLSFSKKLVKKNGMHVLKDSRTSISFQVMEPWEIAQPGKDDPAYLDLLMYHNGIVFSEDNGTGMISIVINKIGNFDIKDYMENDLRSITEYYEQNGGEGKLLQNFTPNFELKPSQSGGAIYIVYNFPDVNETLHQYLIYIKNKKDVIVINVFAAEEEILEDESLQKFLKSIKIK